MTNILRVLCWLLLIAHPTFFCSSPYTVKNSVCVFFSTNRVSWCEAQRQCLEISGELLTGDTALLAIQNRILDASNLKYYWLGLTDMAEERKSLRYGWKWTNGTPTSDSFSWLNNNEPGNQYNQDCLSYGMDNILSDYQCYKINHFICQPAILQDPHLIDRHFKMTNVFVSSNAEAFAAGACTTNLSAESRRQCAFRCLQEVTCVSFYFNKNRAECLLQLFTDAQIDVGDENGWTKFVVQN